MKTLSPIEALELLINREEVRLKCVKGPLSGYHLQGIKAKDGKETRLFRIGNMIVSLEEFIQCEWASIEQCSHCNGTGWIEP